MFKIILITLLLILVGCSDNLPDNLPAGENCDSHENLSYCPDCEPEIIETQKIKYVDKIKEITIFKDCVQDYDKDYVLGLIRQIKRYEKLSGSCTNITLSYYMDEFKKCNNTLHENNERINELTVQYNECGD